MVVLSVEVGWKVPLVQEALAETLGDGEKSSLFLIFLKGQRLGQRWRNGGRGNALRA